MSEIKNLAIRGGAAKIISQIANAGLRVLTMVVLARLLNPSDFGLVAMVTVFTGFLGVFRDFGLTAAAVQRNYISHQERSNLLWLNISLGALLTIACIAMGPWLSEFYADDRISSLCTAVSFTFLFTSAAAQHTATLQREMKFSLIAIIETAAMASGLITSVTFALLGFGYWALITMAVATPMVYFVSVWFAGRWIPSRPKRFGSVASMIQFGGIMTLNSIIVYLAYNVEKLLIGKVWGAEALGVYGRAYQLINIPTENLNSALNDVVFSGLARISDKLELHKQYFLMAYSLVITFTLPITVASAVLADELVLVVLGDQWYDSIKVFRLLAPTIIVFAMINPMGWLLLSLGMARRSLYTGVIIAPVAIGGYVIGIPYGIEGVALGFSSAMVLWLVPHIWLCCRGTAVRTVDILLTCARPLAAALGAGLITYAVMSHLMDELSIYIRLTLGIALVFSTYGLILLFVLRQWRRYVIGLRELRKSR